VTRPIHDGERPLVHRDAAGRERTAPDWETLTERLIREAQADGRFDDLPGLGRPLELADETYAGELALAHHLLRNAGAAPPWIEADKEVRAHRSAIEALLGRARHASGPPGTRLAIELDALADAHDAAAARLESLAPTARQHRSPLDRAALRSRLDEALGERRSG
jgi:hypothetical protein